MFPTASNLCSPLSYCVPLQSFSILLSHLGTGLRRIDLWQVEGPMCLARANKAKEPLRQRRSSRVTRGGRAKRAGAVGPCMAPCWRRRGQGTAWGAAGSERFKYEASIHCRGSGCGVAAEVHALHISVGSQLISGIFRRT